MHTGVFDIFKIGVGPSSSHTMGPMVAASRFLDRLRNSPASHEATSVRVRLHGSLAFTGRGHASDRAVHLGLLGFAPETLDRDAAEAALIELGRTRRLSPAGLPALRYNPDSDLIFDLDSSLPGHPNGLKFETIDADGVVLLHEVYYSIGGGFVVSEGELKAGSASNSGGETARPFPFHTAAEMLDMANRNGLSIAELVRANECAGISDAELESGLRRLWSAMNDCIERGLRAEGELSGGLRLRRRARDIYLQLLEERASNERQPHAGTEWLHAYALAVNEENAAGGRIVTAPTNGASGVLPAVLRYYLDHCAGADANRIGEFLLTAAAIGSLIKVNASISGAEAGCQGEIGSAAAMAAAGLCAVLGGTPNQVENAAEIALEHHLGMTCDPVAGLVQVPCIERNAVGAVKAVSATSLALRGKGDHYMPLDNCIRAMRDIGKEMSAKLKETSLGGLAINLPEC